jgi:hypothetical protein
LLKKWNVARVLICTLACSVRQETEVLDVF